MGAQAQSNVVRAERSRRFPIVPFISGNLASLDIPRDSIYKSFDVTLAGAVSPTYTGTYTTDVSTTIDALIQRIDVVINGNRTVKSVRPWLCATKSLYYTAIQPERKSSAGAAALVPPNPTADGGFAVPTSTQFTTVRETITIYFEDVLSTEPRSGSFLNLKGAASAEIRFNFGTYSNLEAKNNAATSISYATGTFNIEVSTREAPDLNGTFIDLKETTKSVNISAQVTDQAIDINRGNFVRGIWLLVRDGGTALQPFTNTAITGLQLVANGFFPIKQYGTASTQGFLKLQSENRANYGLNVAYAANVSRIDGIAYMDLLNNRNSGTALDARFLDNLQLLISTAAAGSGATYTTNAVSLTLQTDEYVMPV